MLTYEQTAELEPFERTVTPERAIAEYAEHGMSDPDNEYDRDLEMGYLEVNDFGRVCRASLCRALGY